LGTPRIEISVRWFRKDTLDECARKTSDLLQDFIKFYPDWIPFSYSATIKSAEIPQLYEVPTLEELKKIIVQGYDKRCSVDHGSSITYFNLRSDEKTHKNYKKLIEIDIRCGCYNGHENYSCFGFPPFNEDAKNIVNAEFFKNAFDLLIKHWTPLWGHVTFQILTETFEECENIGWLTYFSDELRELPTFPSWVKLIPVEEKGTYIQIAEKISLWDMDDYIELYLNNITELYETISPWLEDKKKRFVIVSPTAEFVQPF
jgi:hypothetical protein